MIQKKFLINHVLLPHWGVALPEMLFYEVIIPAEAVKSRFSIISIFTLKNKE